MILPILHLVMHVAVPGLTARLAYKKIWFKAWLIMMLTMAMDLDHLLATPIYDPERCGINFHPLHSYPAIGAYLILLVIPRLRILGVGFLIHVGLDTMDCLV